MKNMKYVVLVSFIVMTVFLTSCSNVAGIDESVSVGNMTVTVTDIYTENQYTYMIARLTFNTPGSYIDGVFTSCNVVGNGNGGYSFDLIGYNKEEQTQTYLVQYHPTPKSKKIVMELGSYRSQINPLELISDARFKFSIDLSESSVPIKTVEINDQVISRIQIFRDLIIIESARIDNKYADLKGYDIEVCSIDDTEIAVGINTLDLDKSAHKAYLLLNDEVEDQTSIEILINEKTYLINLSEGE